MSYVMTLFSKTPRKQNALKVYFRVPPTRIQPILIAFTRAAGVLQEQLSNSDRMLN